MARVPFVAGNWKMNMTQGEASDLLAELLPMVQSFRDIDIAVCPPFTALATVRERLRGTPVKLGAQNCHAAAKDGKPVHAGAYTGEVSARMLADAGVSWVILGHSERRQYFGETDAGVNLKVRAALECGVGAIVCVGETLAEREAGTTFGVIDTQVRGCLGGLPGDDVARIVIAYEPVWAIGTGRTATPDQAQEVHAHIRTRLVQMFGEAVAQSVRIQYGGSMKASNAAQLLALPDVDGGLIGGAALQAKEFAEILQAARLR